MIRKTAITAAALAASVGVAKAEMPPQINFGIISTESASALEKSFQPFLYHFALIRTRGPIVDIQCS